MPYCYPRKANNKKRLYILYIGQFELLLYRVYIIYCNSYFSKVIMVDTHSLESWQNIIRFTRSCVLTYGLLEVFNNVHPRLGGLHTIMNPSGSVGNLWWCRPNAIPDLIKHCKTKLLLRLHEVLCQCWQEEAVPQDMRDSKIITIYKNKGERND